MDDIRKRLSQTLGVNAMVFVGTDEATAPYLVEAGHGQGPEGKRTLVVHVYKRLGIDKRVAQKTIACALINVFGADAYKGLSENDYMDYKELKKRGVADYAGADGRGIHCDSVCVIFGVESKWAKADLAWVRNNMARALAYWHHRSLTDASF